MNKGLVRGKPFPFLILHKDMKNVKGSMSGNWGVLHISTTSPNCLETFGSLIHHAKEVADMFSTSVAKRSEPGEKVVVLCHNYARHRLVHSRRGHVCLGEHNPARGQFPTRTRFAILINAFLGVNHDQLALPINRRVTPSSAPFPPAHHCRSSSTTWTSQSRGQIKNYIHLARSMQGSCV